MSGQQNRSDYLTKDSYRSGKLLNPKSRKIKEKYFEIYETYVLTHATEKQLADKYSLGLSHISAIIKWCVHQMDTGDPSDHFRVMDDKISAKLQGLERELLKQDLTHKEILMTYAEIRRTLKFQAQIRKILGNDAIPPGVAVQVNMTSNVPHRTGTKSVQAEVINAENENG